VSRRYNCADDEQRKAGIADAASTVRRGELVVLPTDTVYGVGADAFNPAAVTALRNAKQRGREHPPAVLVGTVRAAQALIDDLGKYGQDLIEEFWPDVEISYSRLEETAPRGSAYDDAVHEHFSFTRPVGFDFAERVDDFLSAVARTLEQLAAIAERQ